MAQPDEGRHCRSTLHKAARAKATGDWRGVLEILSTIEPEVLDPRQRRHRNEMFTWADRERLRLERARLRDVLNRAVSTRVPDRDEVSQLVESLFKLGSSMSEVLGSDPHPEVLFAASDHGHLARPEPQIAGSAYRPEWDSGRCLVEAAKLGHVGARHRLEAQACGGRPDALCALYEVERSLGTKPASLVALLSRIEPPDNMVLKKMHELSLEAQDIDAARTHALRAARTQHRWERDWAERWLFDNAVDDERKREWAERAADGYYEPAQEWLAQDRARSLERDVSATRQAQDLITLVGLLARAARQSDSRELARASFGELAAIANGSDRASALAAANHLSELGNKRRAKWAKRVEELEALPEGLPATPVTPGQCSAWAAAHLAGDRSALPVLLHHARRRHKEALGAVLALAEQDPQLLAASSSEDLDVTGNADGVALLVLARNQGNTAALGALVGKAKRGADHALRAVAQLAVDDQDRGLAKLVIKRCEHSRQALAILARFPDPYVTGQVARLHPREGSRAVVEIFLEMGNWADADRLRSRHERAIHVLEIGGAVELLGRIPDPPECEACAQCPACTETGSCSGCFGCNGCTDCPRCTCPFCRATPERDRKTLGALAEPTPCSRQVLRTVRRVMADRRGVHELTGAQWWVAMSADDERCPQHPDSVHPREGRDWLIRVSRGCVTGLADDGLRIAPDASDAARVWWQDVHSPECGSLTTIGPRPLRAWQREALDSWAAHGRRGVIEAVTGAGKTWLGIAAIHEAIADDHQVVVVVPTKVLQEQWTRELGAHGVPRHHIHHIGGDRTDRITATRAIPRFGVTVAVMHSLADRFRREPDVHRHLARNALVVADECHRLTRSFQDAISEGFTRRLGLTATLDGDVDVEALFGGSVYQLGFGRALADGSVAPYRLLLLGLPLEKDLKDEYDRTVTRLRQLEEKFRKADAALNPRGGYHRFTSQVRGIANTPEHPLHEQAANWVELDKRVSKILDRADGRSGAVQAIAPAVRGAHGALLFTATKLEAQDSARTLRGPLGEGAAWSLTGDDRQDDRRRILRALRPGTAVSAPMILDEGVNVPNADLAMIVNGSNRARQAIQRRGRVIRPMPGKTALLVVVFLAGTRDDPANPDFEESYTQSLLQDADEHAVVHLNDRGELNSVLDQWMSCDHSPCPGGHRAA